MTSEDSGNRRYNGPDLVPVRMVNEFCFCPRLAYLEWVQGEWADNVFTVDGRFRHRRVDVDRSENATEDRKLHVTSLTLSSERIGAIARVDLVEFDGVIAVPVDYKRGRTTCPSEDGVWEPDQIQLCLQGLLLRDNGYQCDYGIVYYVGSKRRIRVDFDSVLEERSIELLNNLREVAESGQIPSPLEDSGKCYGCSLVGICLPDEVRLLSENKDVDKSGEVRRLIPVRDDLLPLYVQEQGAKITKRGNELVITGRGFQQFVRLMDVSHIGLFGSVQITTQALRAACERSIPVCYFSYGGWFYAITHGFPHKNIELRQAQFRTADEPDRSLLISRQFIGGKVRNARTLLRRNSESASDGVLRELMGVIKKIKRIESIPSLLGLEGYAASLYFQSFGGLLKLEDSAVDFHFDHRNRRPPRDPVNAVLSFLYAMLTKEMTVSLLAVGLDPYLGFLHRPRYGRPSLALDLMEEFRALIVDSVTVRMFNNGELQASDFSITQVGVAIKSWARKRVIKAYEGRLDSVIRHPLFGYSISYRRIIAVQARLLARWIAGEIEEYPPFVTR